ncbi:MAG: EamA family transporter [Bacteroidia bacterium]|nr:MAG: EamA family transporter [Bacteroidia bacterium]
MEFRIGELAALATAICWTITAITFEAASRKVGSIPVNIIRLVMAFFLIALFSWIIRDMPFPADATSHQWFWLAISGLVGFVIGDLFLFKAFTVIGSRLSLLIMTLVPPIAAFVGWLMMGETLAWIHLGGMALTMSGIGMVILHKRGRKNHRGELPEHVPPTGIIFALLGALGQAVGLVLSKYGMQDYDAFSATQIRVMAGIIGFAVVIHVFKKWGAVETALNNRTALWLMLLGAVFGPFLGVTSSLIAVKYTATGIASTIMSISPILILPATYLLYKQQITWKELLGAFISVTGVALFFI